MTKRISEEVCSDCGGQGTLPQPYYPDGHSIRFIDKVCKKCDGLGMIFTGRFSGV